MDYEKVNLLLQIWKTTIEVGDHSDIECLLSQTRALYGEELTKIIIEESYKDRMYGCKDNKRIMEILAETRVFAGTELDRLIKEQLAKNDVDGEPTVK